MTHRADKTTGKPSQAIVTHVAQRQGKSKPAVQLAHNLQAAANNSPQVKQMQTYQAMADGYSAGKVVQKKAVINAGPVVQRAELRPASGTGDTRKKKIITTDGFETNHLTDESVTDELALARREARTDNAEKNTLVNRAALITKIGDTNPPEDGVTTVTYNGFAGNEAKNVLKPSKDDPIGAYDAGSVTLLAGAGNHDEIKLFHLDSAGQDIIGKGGFPSLARVVPPAPTPRTPATGAGTPTGEPRMTKTARKKASKAARGF